MADANIIFRWNVLFHSTFRPFTTFSHLFSFVFFPSFFSFLFSLFLFAAFQFAVGLSLAAPKTSNSLNDLAETFKSDQYFDSTNMAYVLELSNHKSNQNTNGQNDDNNGNIINGNQRNTNVGHYTGIANKNTIANTNDIGVDVGTKRTQQQQQLRSHQVNETIDGDIGGFHSNIDNKNYLNHLQFDEDRGVNNPLNRGPFFDVSASKNVTALVGKSANLNCRIKNLGNKTVRMI